MKFYYLRNEIDDNYQEIKDNNNKSSNSLQQISIVNGKTILYNNTTNLPTGFIYYTFSLNNNRIIASGIIELKNIGSFFYNFIEYIQIVNRIPVIPTGTIIKTNLNYGSGSGQFLNKKGHIIISYLEDRCNFEIILLS